MGKRQHLDASNERKFQIFPITIHSPDPKEVILRPYGVQVGPSSAEVCLLHLSSRPQSFYLHPTGARGRNAPEPSLTHSGLAATHRTTDTLWPFLCFAPLGHPHNYQTAPGCFTTFLSALCALAGRWCSIEKQSPTQTPCTAHTTKWHSQTLYRHQTLLMQTQSVTRNHVVHLPLCLPHSCCHFHASQTGSIKLVNISILWRIFVLLWKKTPQEMLFDDCNLGQKLSQSTFFKSFDFMFHTVRFIHTFYFFRSSDRPVVSVVNKICFRVKRHDTIPIILEWKRWQGDFILNVTLFLLGWTVASLELALRMKAQVRPREERLLLFPSVAFPPLKKPYILICNICVGRAFQNGCSLEDDCRVCSNFG